MRSAKGFILFSTKKKYVYIYSLQKSTNRHFQQSHNVYISNVRQHICNLEFNASKTRKLCLEIYFIYHTGMYCHLSGWGCVFNSFYNIPGNTYRVGRFFFFCLVSFFFFTLNIKFDENLNTSTSVFRLPK